MSDIEFTIITTAILLYASAIGMNCLLNIYSSQSISYIDLSL